MKRGSVSSISERSVEWEGVEGMRKGEERSGCGGVRKKKN